MYRSPVSPLPTKPSMAEEISKLAELRDRGVLTEEEFQAQKTRLLAAPPSATPDLEACASCGAYYPSEEMAEWFSSRYCPDCYARTVAP
ncbi:MAG: SHOCT domain-containing protein [Bacteroidetes bacterium]|nr:SHOCT domain-containing protein [Bacteroidota bacterium]